MEKEGSRRFKVFFTADDAMDHALRACAVGLLFAHMPHMVINFSPSGQSRESTRRNVNSPEKFHTYTFVAGLLLLHCQPQIETW